MELEVSQKEGRVPVTVFRVDGDMGAESSDSLIQQVDSALQGGMRHLLLDLSNVSYVSSAGLKAIHHALSAFAQIQRQRAVRRCARV